MISRALVSVLALPALVGFPFAVFGQAQSKTGPPVPYEDPGACPFEGCVYREWTATARTVIRTERSTKAPVAFTVRRGEHVAAVTGVVITVKAGRVQFRAPIDLGSQSGTLHIKPGDTLFLLTYRGEGFTKAWFQGRVWDDVDGAMAFFNGCCEHDPDSCAGRIIERPGSVWWVKIRNARGQAGWTNHPENFDGKDALGN